MKVGLRFGTSGVVQRIRAPVGVQGQAAPSPGLGLTRPLSHHWTILQSTLTAQGSAGVPWQPQGTWTQEKIFSNTSVISSQLGFFSACMAFCILWSGPIASHFCTSLHVKSIAPIVPAPSAEGQVCCVLLHEAATPNSTVFKLVASLTAHILHQRSCLFDMKID